MGLAGDDDGVGSAEGSSSDAAAGNELSAISAEQARAAAHQARWRLLDRLFLLCIVAP